MSVVLLVDSTSACPHFWGKISELYDGGGSLTNNGTITGGNGGAGGVGVSFSGGAGTLINQKGGAISGGVVKGNFANNVTLQIGSQVRGGLNVGTSTAATLTLSDDGSGGSQTYSGAVSGTTTFSGALAKSGSGTWTLDQALGTTGTTSVNAGTLLAANASGSATGTGAVSVNSGGTLGGTGTVSGAVTVQSGGTLSPGLNAPGRLTLGSTLSLPVGSLLAVELGGLTAGTQYDQVAVGGQLTLGGNLSVSVVNGFNLAVGQSFTILVDGGTSATSGAFANAVGGTLYTDSRGDTFFINYLANADGGTIPNDVQLTVTSVVPEPSTWVFLVGGSLLLTAFARRRRATSALS